MTGICLGVGGLVAALLAVDHFSLAWTHSIEKIRWEEDYRATRAGLELTEARVRGSGAGMEPPAGAVLRDGVWHYRPALGALPRLSLARSGAVADFELCIGGACRRLGAYLPPRYANTGDVDLAPCETD